MVPHCFPTLDSFNYGENVDNVESVENIEKKKVIKVQGAPKKFTGGP